MTGQKAIAVGCLLIFVLGSTASAAIITETITFDTVQPPPNIVANGLSAEATFTFDTTDATELEIELINTSTGVPTGFDNADQILTSISFDMGQSGENALDPEITSGTVVVGTGSVSLNFDNVVSQLVAGDDTSGEWGYGNGGTTGLLPNFVSTNQAGTTRFTGSNLDGNNPLDGPQGGVVTDPPQVALGGLGAIGDSIVITLTLDTALSNLDFLEDNGAVVEFGSDAAFMIPEPATVTALIVGACLLLLRRRVI